MKCRRGWRKSNKGSKRGGEKSRSSVIKRKGISLVIRRKKASHAFRRNRSGDTKKSFAVKHRGKRAEKLGVSNCNVLFKSSRGDPLMFTPSLDKRL